MTIDIDRLTEAELVDLNNHIVERLRFLHQARSHKRMLEFGIGDRVCFQPEGRTTIARIPYRGRPFPSQALNECHRQSARHATPHP